MTNTATANVFTTRMVQADSGAVRPVHAHTCSECLFVGHLDMDGAHAFDLWVCYAEHDANRPGSEQLCLRFDAEDAGYACFPAFVAAHADGALGTGGRWAAAHALYQEWLAAGKPETDIQHTAEWFDHFTRATHGALREDESGESGTTFTVYGLSAKVTKAHVDAYVADQHPATRCMHDYDCCGHAYHGPATWTYLPGTADRAIVVTQGWYLNI